MCRCENISLCSNLDCLFHISALAITQVQIVQTKQALIVVQHYQTPCVLWSQTLQVNSSEIPVSSLGSVNLSQSVIFGLLRLFLPVNIQYIVKGKSRSLEYQARIVKLKKNCVTFLNLKPGYYQQLFKHKINKISSLQHICQVFRAPVLIIDIYNHKTDTF